MRVVIGFTGVARCGKDTAARYLVERYNFRIVRFAGALKDMARAIGLTENQIEGDEKEQPCELLGWKSPRFFMQALGTDLGRDLICNDLWTRIWKHRVSEVPDGVGVVAPDCRFANESAAVAELGGEVIRIRAARPGVGIAGQHVSEFQTVPANMAIDNNGDIKDFLAEIDRLARDQFGLTRYA